MTRGGGGVSSLLFKLYLIKKTHKKHLKIYQQITEVFPELRRIPLEQCSDYKQGLECQFHLSYLLGQALIKADKTWYKGGYFKLFKDIKEAKQIYKAFKEMKEELGVVPNLEGIKANHLKKSLVSKEEFQSLLKTSYIPLQNLILDNFAFILEHLELIYLWLNSKEFKDKYEKENYPYPPLLNPDILNELLNLEDEQDKETLRIKLKELSNTQHTNALSDTIKAYAKAGLDYRLIEAEKAWEMNLPLPRRYEFVLMFSHGAGALAMNHFLFWSAQFNLIEYFYGGVAEVRYGNFYQRLLKENNNIVGISDTSELLYGSIENRNKLWSLMDKKVKALVLVRDPIELIKHCYGRKWGTSWARLKEFTLKHNFEDVIKAPEPYKYDFPSSYKHLENQCFLWNTFKEHFPYLDFKYLDVREFTGQNTIKTMQKLALEFGFNIKLSTEEQENMFVKNMFAGNLNFLLPLTLKIGKIKIEFSILKKDENLLDLRKEFELKESQNQLGIYILKSDYKKLLKNHKLYEETFHYIQNFYNKLLERIKLEDELMLKPEDILEHLKKNEACCKELKGVLDYESKDLKATRPDIVASWKYYGEFERMCGEFNKEN